MSTTLGGLRCSGWQQEAALRISRTTCTADVAEKPSELQRIERRIATGYPDVS